MDEVSSIRRLFLCSYSVIFEDVSMLDTDTDVPPVPLQIDSLPLDNNEVLSGCP